jgi:hypothetical protein
MSAACAKNVAETRVAADARRSERDGRSLDDGHLKQIAEFPVAAEVQLGIVAQLLDPRR